MVSKGKREFLMTDVALGSVLTSRYCIPQECLSVLHQICGTTVPFDLRCESVTCTLYKP